MPVKQGGLEFVSRRMNWQVFVFKGIFDGEFQKSGLREKIYVDSCGIFFFL